MKSFDQRLQFVQYGLNDTILVNDLVKTYGTNAYSLVSHTLEAHRFEIFGCIEYLHEH